jgi:hypothetical protein
MAFWICVFWGSAPEKNKLPQIPFDCAQGRLSTALAAKNAANFVQLISQKTSDSSCPVSDRMKKVP